MKCTKHEQHDCVYCGRDKLESALAAASTRIFELERKLSKAEIERGWAIGEHKKALAELEALRAQKPCLFAYKIFSSSSGFVYAEDELEAARLGSDTGGYKKLYAQPVPAPVLAEAVPVGYFQKHPVTGVWEETVGDGVLLYAAPPAPVMPADGYVQTGINSPFNACMYREGDNILVPRGLIGAACSAIDKQRQAPKILEALRCYTMSAVAMPADVQNRITELEAENQALRADAERYRFMRVKACIISGVFHILNMPNAGDEWRQKYDAAEQLDAAIDAAREVKDGH